MRFDFREQRKKETDNEMVRIGDFACICIGIHIPPCVFHLYLY
jgi:hypothetical protein